MPNTFKATFGVSSSPGNKRVNVAFLCRYGVAGKQSQFSGNHLVAEVAVAAALAVKAVLKSSSPTIGMVTVIGCPDTLYGGVATLVNLRVFKNIDVVMTAVPGPRTDWCPNFRGRKTFRATYKRSSEEVESMEIDPPTPMDEQDVCMLAYQNVLATQEHFSKGWRMKATFGRTGRKHETRMVVCTSAPSNPELFYMEKRVTPCLEAAARVAGCEVRLYGTLHFSDPSVALVTCEVDLAQKTFYSFVSNVQLCYLLQLNAYHCGTLATPIVKSKPMMDAIDVGNVSHVVPTLMPMYYIGADAEVGSQEFEQVLRTHTAHVYTVAIAKALAMTAVDVLTTQGSIDKVKEDLADSLVQEKKKTIFKPFPLQPPQQCMVKVDLPFEGNTGWSRRL